MALKKTVEVSLKKKDNGEFYADISKRDRFDIQEIYKTITSRYGGKVKIVISNVAKSKTVKQNGYLHAIIQEICKETGDDFDVTKLMVKCMAIPRGYSLLLDDNGNTQHIKPFGIIRTKSVSNASKKEVAMLIDSAKQLADENNIRLRGE